MAKAYDDKEKRSRKQRELDHLTAINALLKKIQNHNYYKPFIGVINQLETLADIKNISVRYKADLPEQQQQEPPFAGYLLGDFKDLRRMFFSPGPIADPEVNETDWWGTARALYHAGFKKGDIVQNCFSYHFTPAGAMFECGLSELGIVTIPAGVGNSELQARAIAHFGTTGYVGTPDYLRVILECADRLGLDSSSLQKGLVTGGYYSPELKKFYQNREIQIFECFGTADCGIIAYQDQIDGVLWLNEHIYLEIVYPGSDIPVMRGQVGEMVVTRVDDIAPLIRFSTGDLTSFATIESTRDAITGWRGRADQSAKIKGQFVRPQHIVQICKRHPEIIRACLEISQEKGYDKMCLLVESKISDPRFYSDVA
ncbi:MAG: phenylacetate--CoA ligase family protein, partial [Pseudomonadota bacterium]